MNKIPFKKFTYLFNKLLRFMLDQEYASTNLPSKKELVRLKLANTEEDAKSIISMIKDKVDHRKVILKMIWLHFDNPDTLWENGDGDMMRFPKGNGGKRDKQSRWQMFLHFMHY